MRRKTLLLGCSVALLATIAIGCNFGPDDSFHGSNDYEPVVFPWEGQLADPGGPYAWGSTAAVIVDSDYQVAYKARESFDLHKGRVRILIRDTKPGEGPEWDPPVEAHLRSVFSLDEPLTTKIHGIRPGAWFTVALFDLPPADQLGNPLETDFPFTASIDVEIDGEVAYSPRFLVTGASGRPNPLADEHLIGQAGFQASLEPRRMVRLRGKIGAGKFAQNMGPFGALEFDFAYSPDCVSIVQAYPSSEASFGLALAGPPTDAGDLKKVHVVLIDPRGFRMGNYTSQLAGAGPWVDLVFVDVPGSPCTLEPSQFHVSDVRVTNPDGAILIDAQGEVLLDTKEAPDQDALFRMYSIDVDDT